MFFDEALIDACILIVDDEEANVRLVRSALGKVGCNNLHCTTKPESVLDFCRQHPVELILLDLSMPRLHGLDLMKLLQAELDNPPQIIVLTAMTSSEDKITALELGALDYLTKPLHIHELLLRVRNGLRLVRLNIELTHERDNLDAEVKRQTQELEQTRDEILYRLGRATEFRDNETGTHVIRMSESVYLLTKAATGDEAFANQLKKAAQMHDVGKIGIPDGVLMKRGKLDEQEFNVMKSHARIGHEILADAKTPLMKMAAEVALSHHERWDGSGYPNGLKGEEIPLESRIVALCDVFDALRSIRPYKTPWALDDAVGYIRNETGKHFDPKLAELFLGLIDEIEAVRLEYPDPNIEMEIDDLIL